MFSDVLTPILRTIFLFRMVAIHSAHLYLIFSMSANVRCVVGTGMHWLAATDMPEPEPLADGESAV